MWLRNVCFGCEFVVLFTHSHSQTDWHTLARTRTAPICTQLMTKIEYLFIDHKNDDTPKIWRKNKKLLPSENRTVRCKVIDVVGEIWWSARAHVIKKFAGKLVGNTHETDELDEPNATMPICINSIAQKWNGKREKKNAQKWASEWTNTHTHVRPHVAEGTRRITHPHNIASHAWKQSKRRGPHVLYRIIHMARQSIHCDEIVRLTHIILHMNTQWHTMCCVTWTANAIAHKHTRARNAIRRQKNLKSFSFHFGRSHMMRSYDELLRARFSDSWHVRTRCRVE